MKVITLNEPDLEAACNELADKIAGFDNAVVLIGIRTGGAKIGKRVYEVLSAKNDRLKYFEAGASRSTTATKKNRAVMGLFKCMPVFVRDWLRVMEHHMVRLRMKISQQVDRSVSLEQGLVESLTGLEAGRLLIIDDAIDSGATVKAVVERLKSINPGLEYTVAVLVVTQRTPLVSPDVCLFRDVLLRFPWSSDY